MLGRLHSKARKRMLFTVSTERMVDRHSRVRMGMIPMSRGMPKSCMGTAARSAMSRESTSSEGSSWPICRFPMRRMPTIISRYRMTVRMTAVIIGACLLSFGRFLWQSARKFPPLSPDFL